MRTDDRASAQIEGQVPRVDPRPVRDLDDDAYAAGHPAVGELLRYPRFPVLAVDVTARRERFGRAQHAAGGALEVRLQPGAERARRDRLDRLPQPLAVQRRLYALLGAGPFHRSGGEVVRRDDDPASDGSDSARSMVS
ncbi:hypothetical protein [Streptomyces sp. FIT100]|uniref:hypothetical protein n=1 Tax=Streptomyces sp. FIT100 TaxID=2837956 RepID=UPI0021C6489A|nr:hypothetical protein [Streptomyces sp. FIT100]UUN31624.1 hypothetical protein KK483_28565 [Streptomyces sp. FIT100]